MAPARRRAADAQSGGDGPMGRFVMRTRVRSFAGALVVTVLALSSFGVGSAAPAAPAPLRPGYWAFTAQGGVYPYGGADSMFGPASVMSGLRAPIVGAAATPARDGYWMVAADGGVFAFGHAGFYGS